MQRRIFGLVLAGVLLLAGSVAASCRWVSIWDSRTMQYRFEQHCTDDVVVAPGDSFLDTLDGINRDINRRRREQQQPRCETISVWDAETGDYHYEQRCQ